MGIQSFFFIFLVSMSINMILTPLAVRFASRLGLVDQPGGRKIHVSPIPRVGGITFLVSVLMAIGLALFILPLVHLQIFSGQGDKLAILLLGALLAGLLGLADDLLELKPSVKFAFQVLLSSTFALLAYRFNFFHIPGFPILSLSFLSVPFTAFWIMAVMNGFNFMDGVDGLAGSVSFVTLVGLGVAGHIQEDPCYSVLTAAGLGALVVFLAYNRRPAKIYLGDTGANVLGFLSAAGLVSLGQPEILGFHPDPSVAHEPFRFHFVLATLLVGYPFLEIFLSTIRRGIKKFYFGRSMEWSEKEHIHHLLMKMGFGPMRISFMCASFNLLMVTAGLLVMIDEKALAVFCFIPLVFILAVFMPKAGFFDFMDTRVLSEKRSYYLMAHHFMEMQQVKLNLVASPKEVLALVSQTCAEFGVQGFWIKSEPNAEGKGALIFSWERPHDIQREYLQFVKTELISGDFEIFKDRVSIESEKIEAYWLFEPHTQESDLDVEYRVLVSGFMKAVLQRIISMRRTSPGESNVQIDNLSHANVRSSLLRQRYRAKKGKAVIPG